MRIENLAREVLERNGETLEDYDGMCGELADQVFHLVGDDRRCASLYIEGLLLNAAWNYHMVALVDGLVHDAWLPGPPLPPAAWVAATAGGCPVTVSLNGEDVYTGNGDRFPVDWVPPAR